MQFAATVSPRRRCGNAYLPGRRRRRRGCRERRGSLCEEFLQRRATQRHVLQEAAETLRAERLQTRLSVRGERRNHCRVQRLPRREDEVERATHVLDQVFLLLAVNARAQTVASQEERRQSDAPLGGAERAHDGRQLLRGKRQGRCAVVRAGETRVERSGGV